MRNKYEVSSNSEEQLEVVDILIKYERYDMALESLINIRENYPEIEEVYFKISEVYEKKGLIQKAIEEMRKLEHINDTSGEVKFKLATLYQQDNQLDKTFRYLALAMNSGYDSEKIFFYKGLVYEDQNKLDEAIILYNQALKKNISYMAPKYRLYYIYLNTNKESEAQDILDKMIRYNPDDYDGYSLKISYYLSKNIYDKVKNTLEIASGIFGELEALQLDYIKYYVTLRNLEKALEIIDKIGDDNAFYSNFMIYKAKILSIKGEYTKALEILTHKDIFDSSNEDIIYTIALLRYKNEEYSMLINEVDLISKEDEFDLTSDHMKIVEILKAYSYLNINSIEKSQEVFEELEKALKIIQLSNPYDTNTLIFRMIVLTELGNFEKVDILKDALLKLSREKFENIISDIEILIEVKKENKVDHQAQRDILTRIFK